MAALNEWLSTIDGMSGSDLRPASEDASFRRYFRLHKGTQSFIVMDAPPEREDCVPFIRVAGFLESMQLNAPRIVEADLDAGFLLMTDLGSQQYLDRLRADSDAAGRLYSDALTALAQMQRRGTSFQALLPPYDEELLRFELSLFHDWLCGTHLGIQLSAAEESSWQALCDVLVRNALEQPAVFVHRDYHSRNLMVTTKNNPGIVDFQDAVEGPLTYDLVSLLKDCYVVWEPQQVQAWVREYYDLLDEKMRQQVDFSAFNHYFDLMGAQRHIKAAGIFSRLNHRDGKPAYMRDVPRTLEYIVQLGPRYSELQWLVELITTRCLPALRAAN